MRIRQNRLSLEEIGGEEEVVVSVLPEVEEAATDVEEAATDIVDQTAAMEDAVDDAETLTDMAEVAADAVEEGTGIDENTAEVLDIATEAICAKLDLSGGRVVASLESFGSTNSKVAATRIAVESVSDRIKEIWTKVKEFFKNLWSKIVGLYEYITSSATRLQSAAKSLKEKAASIEGSPKQAKFKSESIAHGIGHDAAQVSKLIKDHHKLTMEIGPIFSKVEEVTKAAEEVITAAKEGKAAPKLEALTKSKEGLAAAATSIIGQGVALYGGAKASVSNGEVAFSRDGEGKGSEEVAVLTKPQMEEICADVIELAKATDAFKKVKNTVQKSVDNCVKAADAAIYSVDALSKTKDQKEAGALEAVAQAKKAVSAVGGSIAKLTVALPSMNISAGKTALRYVEGSMREYGKKEEKKD